ncbi:TPA: BREX-1 system adenine-specific DNA-methyltransferase PglX, partial [Escherichia coli]|nr:BREX-1 system adenine-specific DNA-methyltransferase PglX [Escherichia coli]
MNTNNIKKYAPKARREFMDAVAKRLNTFGITANKKGELQIAEANLQGSVLQIAGNSFDGKLAEPRKRIVARSQKLGYAQLIEQVAYTWFNRLCAIRYMEIHDYLGHGFRVLSHPDNPKGFEIIDHAQDAADELGLDRARIVELKLAGNKDEELYRELLLGQCHKLHEAMPFLFDALDDETELLLPDNLTRTDSILRGLVDGIPEEDWQQVEVIGWLYQFYISEKKDQVMGKVVKSEDIPAATQLFTPNWIVKYLVQNSVGRQWLQTYPDSAIKTQMEYYIEPAEQSDEVNQQLKAITPESIEPETIKVLDPACGSGHILIEAYNVLKAIYEERGFRSRDIPKMILENNLYGLDIDDRAAQLSGFALMMMARDDDKRIFTRNVRLNVLSLQESNHIDLPTLWRALNLSGSWQSGTSQGLFSDEEQDLSSFNADNRYQLLKRTLARFTQAKTFGSLIDVPSDDHEQLKELLSTLVELQESGDSMQKPAAKQL